MTLNVCILYGSLRDNREGIKVAQYLLEKVKDQGHHVDFIDAKKENLPLLNKRYMDYPKGEAPQNLENLASLYRKADAFVVVSGEYNGSIQPGLKNLLDYFYFEYFHRPAGIVTYSISALGGVRAAPQLRMALSMLGMVSIPNNLVIPTVTDSFDQQGQPLDNSLAQRTDRFLTQLEWYAQALKTERIKGIPE